MTLRMYAARNGWELTTIGVDVRYDVADDERGAIERTITCRSTCLPSSATVWPTSPSGPR